MKMFFKINDEIYKFIMTKEMNNEVAIEVKIITNAIIF